MKKVAFTGASGSGKTTLVKFVEQELGLTHISGSAGDVKKEEDRLILEDMEPLLPIEGHLGVIINSAYNFEYGYENQKMLIKRRGEILRGNDNFVTDRSPIDNFTYLVNQIGFHPQLTDDRVKEHYYQCLGNLTELTHLIYVKSVQPYDNGVENNGSRIHNWFYQQSVDAQFEKWLNSFIEKAKTKNLKLPQILVIDFWDLESRKNLISNFLNGITAG